MIERAAAAFLPRVLHWAAVAAIAGVLLTRADGQAQEPPQNRTYSNVLLRLHDPPPLLNDYPEFVQPIVEESRYEAPMLVDDADADLMVRATVLSCNAMSALYSFEVSAQGQQIASGRTAVIFAIATQDDPALSPTVCGERS